MSTILGVATFLFGLFMAFSISDRGQRIDQIREQDSEERANLLLLAYHAESADRRFHKELLRFVDRYLMATLDYKIQDYGETSKQYLELFRKTTSFRPKGSQQSSAYSNMLSAINEIGVARKKTISLIVDKLSNLEWGVLVFLSAVITISLLSLNSGTFVSIAITTILIVSLAAIFLLLYQLDSLKWKEETRIFEPYQKTFESLGLMRYYPDDIVGRNRTKLHKAKVYRLGMFSRPYPDFSKKRIVIVRPHAKKK